MQADQHSSLSVGAVRVVRDPLSPGLRRDGPRRIPVLEAQSISGFAPWRRNGMRDYPPGRQETTIATEM